MALLAIHNALLVLAGGERHGGVVVGDDGRIEAVLDGARTASAATVVDAHGRLLFPGFVDAHVHMREPGYTQKEDFTSGTLAAAAGGVTTVLCMPNTRPSITDFPGLENARRAAEARAAVDFGFQAGITRGNLTDLAGLWSAGVTSFEAFMADVPDDDRLDTAEHLRAALAEVARCDAIVGVYCGAQSVIAAERTRLQRIGRNDVHAFAEARPALNEVAGLALLLEIAAATGARIVVRQVSSGRGAALIRRAKADALCRLIAAEVTPHHLLLDRSALDRHGTAAQMLPPLRTPADNAALLAGLGDGTLDFVASDHAPHAPAEKDRADAWSAASGTPGLDTLVPAVLHCARTARLTWPLVAEILAHRPAALFGLDKRKGRIAVGLDGDLVLVDPDATRTVERAMIRSRAGRSAFEGTTLVGWPVLTVLRGHVVAESGRPVLGHLRGRLVIRNAA
ncbi:MAG: amidohydrolase family protein [Alphaproteobacteria bacterium]|nr:amidohydrolase family protein [Alphaproteobacteria bacterium]